MEGLYYRNRGIQPRRRRPVDLLPRRTAKPLRVKDLTERCKRARLDFDGYAIGAILGGMFQCEQCESGKTEGRLRT